MDAIKEGMLASAKAAEAAVRLGERLLGQNTPNVMNFNSQICTSREQSERLLALGLKKETADMVHIYLNQWDGWYVRPLDVDESIHHMEIPAWSLHRLLSLIPTELEVNTNPGCGRQWICFNMNFAYNIIYFDSNQEVFVGFYEGDVYNKAISCIEWLIKEGCFNKEYLEDKK